METVKVYLDRWKNRRKMAWLSMFAGLLYPIMVLFTDSPQLGAIAGPFYVFIGMVVATYIGAAVVDDHWQKQDSTHDRHKDYGDRPR